MLQPKCDLNFERFFSKNKHYTTHTCWTNELEREVLRCCFCCCCAAASAVDRLISTCPVLVGCLWNSCTIARNLAYMCQRWCCWLAGWLNCPSWKLQRAHEGKMVMDFIFGAQFRVLAWRSGDRYDDDDRHAIRRSVNCEIVRVS